MITLPSTFVEQYGIKGDGSERIDMVPHHLVLAGGEIDLQEVILKKKS